MLIESPSEVQGNFELVNFRLITSHSQGYESDIDDRGDGSKCGFTDTW